MCYSPGFQKVRGLLADFLHPFQQIFTSRRVTWLKLFSDPSKDSNLINLQIMVDDLILVALVLSGSVLIQLIFTSRSNFQLMTVAIIIYKFFWLVTKRKLFAALLFILCCFFSYLLNLKVARREQEQCPYINKTSFSKGVFDDLLSLFY